MTEILKSLSAMTPQWLTEALTGAGHDPPEVTALDVRPMDDFTGAMGEVGIVSVEYAGGTGLPAEFVAKCPLDNDIARMYASVMLSYQREAGFYADLAAPVAASTGIRIPRCFVNLFDPETHSATLLIERVHPAEKGDILDGTSYERMRTLVGDLARLHAAHWMGRHARRARVADRLDGANAAGRHPLHRRQLGQHPRAGAAPPPDGIAAMISDVFLPDVESWLQRFSQRPWTLIHQDYELDNVLFAAGGPVIVDWQTAMLSFPGIDLGWLLMASHNAETLAREPELLDHYRGELAAAGGPRWSAEDLAEDLAWGAFYWVSVSHVPFMHSLPAGPQDRSHRRFAAMMRGTIAAAQRWDVVERMRQHA